MQGIGLKISALVILILMAMHVSAQSPVTAQEVKTDAIAKQAVHLINVQQADSLYALLGQVAKTKASPDQWALLVKKQLGPLLPFTKVNYLGSDGIINNYRLDCKVPLLLSISLDEKGKIADFLFVPYRDETKPAAMTQEEQNTDVVARKVLGYINTRQADSAYVFAGDDFKAYMDKAAWHDFTEKELYPSAPFPTPVFIRSNKGVNKYRIGELQYTISLDKQGKFNSFGIEIYHEDAKKSIKSASDNPLHSTLDTVVNKWLGIYMQNKSSVGLSAAVYYQGKNHFYNYGETATGNHTLPTAHTLFEIGSITKTFTSTLLAKAIADGLTTLDAPIIKYLPDSVSSNPGLKNITLKQLANHTSGLPRMPTNFDEVVTNLEQPYENYDEAHLFAFLQAFKSVRGAGVSYEYSNVAVGLLGVILEKLYKKPYEQLIKEYIAAPLKLTETTITLTANDKKHLAQGYDEALKPVPVWHQNSTKAAGAIVSSAADMLQYGKAQLADPVNLLSPYLKTTHRITFDDGTNQIGLGWYFYAVKNQSIIQHNGGTGGYKSFIAVNLSRGIVVVVLTNNATDGDTAGSNLMAELSKIITK